jgi:hypothetical protein
MFGGMDARVPRMPFAPPICMEMIHRILVVWEQTLTKWRIVVLVVRLRARSGSQNQSFICIVQAIVM